MKSASTAKPCIFCGNEVVKKSDEHVLGEWLLKKTGDPKRTWSFLTFRKHNPILKFSIDNFVFPACESCNNSAGIIEDRAMPVIDLLENRQSISSKQAEYLLDWLDKVRVGLWLGYRMLSQNPFKVTPKFSISQRVGMKDRLMIVYPYNGKPPNGINLFGHNLPIFYMHPSCFGMRINGSFIINLSDDFIVSRWIGLPYPKDPIIEQSGESTFERMTFRQNPKIPDKILSIFKPSIFVGQSIVSNEIYRHFQHDYWKHFQTGKMKSSDCQRSVSRIFNFLEKDFNLYDTSIRYGEIELQEATQFRNLCQQAFALQQWLYEYCRLGSSSIFTLEIEKMNRQMMKKIVLD